MTNIMEYINKFKPAVQKVWLQLVAGLMWFCVGMMLISLTFEWLKPVVLISMILLITAGILLAGLIYFFGFSKLAKKNIKRIIEINNEKVCFFRFSKMVKLSPDPFHDPSGNFPAHSYSHPQTPPVHSLYRNRRRFIIFQLTLF